VNEENDFHIANSTYKPCKLPKRDKKICKNSPYCVSNAVGIW
jgi:hypothetical protein